MKLPLLKVKHIPSFYKHCSTIYFIHINLTDITLAKELDQDFVDAYFAHVKDQMNQAVEGNFIMNMGSRVLSNDEVFIIFKDAISPKTLHTYMNVLLAEFDEYCEHKAEGSYEFMKGMLCLGDEPMKVLKSGKAGEIAQTSLEWEKYHFSYNKKSHSQGKHLTTIKEFIPRYERLKNVDTKRNEPVKQDKLPKNEVIVEPKETVEEAYQYYI